MSGLRKLCKMYGHLKCGDVLWYWDYVKDEPRIKSEMTKDEINASEKAKWATIKIEPKQLPDNNK